MVNDAAELFQTLRAGDRVLFYVGLPGLVKHDVLRETHRELGSATNCVMNTFGGRLDQFLKVLFLFHAPIFLLDSGLRTDNVCMCVCVCLHGPGTCNSSLFVFTIFLGGLLRI